MGETTGSLPQCLQQRKCETSALTPATRSVICLVCCVQVYASYQKQVDTFRKVLHPERCPCYHKSKPRSDYDQFLEQICGQSRNNIRKLPSYLWPASCRSVVDEKLQEEDTYSSQDDFPLLGQRLAKLQEYNLRQQPSRLRDLWRDRRALI